MNELIHPKDFAHSFVTRIRADLKDLKGEEREAYISEMDEFFRRLGGFPKEPRDD